MKYNDRELAKFGESQPVYEGILQHMKPSGKDWSDWYQQPTFKKRTFKLIANLLYYYRITDQELLGILILENAQISYERPHKGIPFAFSITFKVNDRLRDTESKHIFSGRCAEDVNKWVAVLKMASYEYLRSQYVILKTKISMKTGKDPVLDYMRSKHSSNGTETRTKKEITKKESVVETRKSKSTFYSNCQTSTFYSSTSSQIVTIAKPDKVSIDNLIDL